MFLLGYRRVDLGRGYYKRGVITIWASRALRTRVAIGWISGVRDGEDMTRVGVVRIPQYSEFARQIILNNYERVQTFGLTVKWILEYQEAKRILGHQEMRTFGQGETDIRTS